MQLYVVMSNAVIMSDFICTHFLSLSLSYAHTQKSTDWSIKKKKMMNRAFMAYWHIIFFQALGMATSGYVGDIQPAVQPQGAGVTVTPGQPDTSSTPSTTPQFLAEIQTTVVTPTVVTPTGQAAPPDKPSPITNQKPSAGGQSQSATQTQPSQTQYVTAEIQSSPTQSGNPQSTPQYIVVTVTGKSLNIK